jgi:hypothetical protein
VLARIFVNAWRDLRSSGGSKIRRLTGTPGIDWRLRIASYRAVCSVAGDRSERLHAFIHQFDKRAEIYETDAFHVRLRRFWNTIQSRSRCVDISVFGAEYFEVDPQSASPDSLPRGMLHHELKPRQQQFAELVLPVRATAQDTKSQLLIGRGPPGSGKTVVAQDLVLEAVLDGLKVDVLVPTAPLKDEYRRLFEACGLRVSQSTEGNPDVRVLEFPEHFAMLAEEAINPLRWRQIQEWWNSTSADPRFKARLGTKAASEVDLRLPRLVDAILDDTEFWNTWRARHAATNKDFLGQHFGECVEALERLRHQLDPCTAKGDPLPTRARLAVAALVRAASASPSSDDRLILVDEAQDLAPAECRALLAYWLRTRNGHPDAIRKLVLLGDQEQRISLVPFSWDEVKRTAIRLANIKPVQILEQDVDLASYRMRQSIARVARAVWDERVRGAGRFRREAPLDVDRLETGGTIDVLVTDVKVDLLSHARRTVETAAPGEHLFIVSGGARSASWDHAHIFAYHAREAKGLEASRVIVDCPFGHQRGRRIRNVLPADAVMEFYVAATRAREHLLLVLDPASWAELKRCPEPWRLDGVRIHDLSLGSKTEVQSLVKECLVTLTPDELQYALLDQLTRKCEAADGIAGSVSDGLERIMRRLCGNPNTDMIETILVCSELLARNHAAALKRLWAQGIAAYEAGETSAAIGMMLLAGEIGAAFRIANSEQQSGWDCQFLELYADESAVQSTRKSQSREEVLRHSTSDFICRHARDLAIDRIRTAAAKMRMDVAR